MNLHEAKIKRVLILLENSIELEQKGVSDIEKANNGEFTLNVGQVEKLAKKHLLNESKIALLQNEIDALLKKQSRYEDNNAKAENDIIRMIGNTKNQSLRFGKILVDFTTWEHTTVAPNKPRYIEVVSALQKQFNIEQKIIDDLAKKFNNVGKKKVTPMQNLSITKESRRLVKESLLKDLWRGIKSTWNDFFGVFRYGNDKLEGLLGDIQNN